MFCAGLFSMVVLLATGKKQPSPRNRGPITLPGLWVKGLANMALLRQAHEVRIQQLYDKSALAQFQLKPANFRVM